jgi:hypothetical protein
MTIRANEIPDFILAVKIDPRGEISLSVGNMHQTGRYPRYRPENQKLG